MSWDCHGREGNAPCGLLRIHEPDISLRLSKGLSRETIHGWIQFGSTHDVEVSASRNLISSSVCSYTEIVTGWWKGRPIVNIVEVTRLLGSSDGTNLTRIWSLKMNLLTKLLRLHNMTMIPYTEQDCIWLNVHGYFVRLWSMTGDQDKLRALLSYEIIVCSLQFAVLQFCSFAVLQFWSCSVQFAVCSLHFAVCNLQFAVCSLQFSVFSFQFVQFSVFSFQFAVCSLQFEVCSLKFAVCSLQFAVWRIYRTCRNKLGG